MEHLAGLGVAPRVVRRRLGRGRDLQRAVEGLGPGHRRLPARRERVAPEEAGERGHAGVEDPAAPTERRQRALAVEQVVLEVAVPQRVQILDRPLERHPEPVRRLDAQPSRPPRRAPASGSAVDRLQADRRSPAPGDARADADLERCLVTRSDREPNPEPAGRRLERAPRREDPDTDGAIEPAPVPPRAVSKLEAVAANLGAQVALLAPLPPDLGDVREVRVELEPGDPGPLDRRVVVDRPALAHARADDPLEVDLDGVLGQQRAFGTAPAARHAVPGDERVRLGLVPPDEHRREAVDRQPVARQDPRVVVEQAGRIGVDPAVRGGAQDGVARVNDGRWGWLHAGAHARVGRLREEG